MTKYWFKKPANPENVIIKNGPGPAIESLIRLVCNEQDTVITPRPCYANLFNDWWIKTRVAIVLAYSKKKNHYEPTLAELDDAYETAVCYGSRPKVLFLSNVSNPTGHIYSKDGLY